MSAPSGKNNENGVDLESYLVTKHSAWKGKYKRILTIGTHGISTYNPDKFDLTNRWPYSDVVSVAPSRTGNVSWGWNSLDNGIFSNFAFCAALHFCRTPTSSSSHWRRRRSSIRFDFHANTRTMCLQHCSSSTRNLPNVHVRVSASMRRSITGRVSNCRWRSRWHLAHSTNSIRPPTPSLRATTSKRSTVSLAFKMSREESCSLMVALVVCISSWRSTIMRSFRALYSSAVSLWASTSKSCPHRSHWISSSRSDSVNIRVTSIRHRSQSLSWRRYRRVISSHRRESSVWPIQLWSSVIRRRTTSARCDLWKRFSH